MEPTVNCEWAQRALANIWVREHRKIDEEFAPYCSHHIAATQPTQPKQATTKPASHLNQPTGPLTQPNFPNRSCPASCLKLDQYGTTNSLDALQVKFDDGFTPGQRMMFNALNNRLHRAHDIIMRTWLVNQNLERHLLATQKDRDELRERVGRIGSVYGHYHDRHYAAGKKLEQMIITPKTEYEATARSSSSTGTTSSPKSETSELSDSPLSEDTKVHQVPHNLRAELDIINLLNSRRDLEEDEKLLTGVKREGEELETPNTKRRTIEQDMKTKDLRVALNAEIRYFRRDNVLLKSTEGEVEHIVSAETSDTAPENGKDM